MYCANFEFVASCETQLEEKLEKFTSQNILEKWFYIDLLLMKYTDGKAIRENHNILIFTDLR